MCKCEFHLGFLIIHHLKSECTNFSISFIKKCSCVFPLTLNYSYLKKWSHMASSSQWKVAIMTWSITTPSLRWWIHRNDQQKRHPTLAIYLQISGLIFWKPFMCCRNDIIPYYNLKFMKIGEMYHHAVFTYYILSKWFECKVRLPNFTLFTCCRNDIIIGLL